MDWIIVEGDIALFHSEYFINKFVCTNPLTFKMEITRITFSKDERM
jgi:hypothetical protein